MSALGRTSTAYKDKFVGVKLILEVGTMCSAVEDVIVLACVVRSTSHLRVKEERVDIASGCSGIANFEHRETHRLARCARCRQRTDCLREPCLRRVRSLLYDLRRPKTASLHVVRSCPSPFVVDASLICRWGIYVMFWARVTVGWQIAVCLLTSEVEKIHPSRFG